MQRHELLISLSYCDQTLYPVCIFSPSAFEVADRLLIRLTVLQCLWSVLALWKVTSGGFSFTVSSNCCPQLKADRAFLAASPGNASTAFLSGHQCPIWRTQIWMYKPGFSFKDSYQLIFWFVHYKHTKLRMQFCQFQREEQYPASSFRAIFLLEG